MTALMGKKLAVALLAAFLAVALAAAAMRAVRRPAPRPPMVEITQVPEVRFTLLSGESVAASDLRGKALVVNFWATYCGSCLKEMPQLVETHLKFAPRGHELIAVAVRRDQPERVAQVVAERNLPFKLAMDADGTLARDFGNVRITPSTFVIDREGRVLARYIGEPPWSELHALLERL
jgi:peroxiredoxin